MKDKEIYDLKHELISAQIKLESNEKSIAELEKENKELLLNKAKLEASLEDALLGKVKGQAESTEHSHKNSKDKSSEKSTQTKSLNEEKNK